MTKRVEEFELVLSRTRWTYEIILADDGSTDGSPDLCQRLVEGTSNRRYLPSAKNRGRGKNVSDAFQLCAGKYVGFADVDSSTSASYIVPLLIALEKGADMAVANRTYKIRLFELPFILHRLATHLVYRWMVRGILGLRQHDTESGFKFFRAEAVKALCPVSTAPGWFWDTEIMANAHLLGLRISEFPTVFLRTPGMGSTVKLVRDSWVQGVALLKFRWRYRNKTFRTVCCRRLP
jgi:glycosyltransferase involved in cell wall biosynthesis